MERPDSQTASGTPDYRLSLESPARASALGAQLGPLLRTGDTLLLQGTLGAGKTHLARALVRAWAGQPDLEVTSPTYTLANVYDRPADAACLWHADLYRLGASEELEEIGLDEAAEDCVVLAEWPERWGAWPERHALFHLEASGPESRDLAISLAGGNWQHLAGVLNAWT